MGQIELKKCVYCGETFKFSFNEVKCPFCGNVNHVVEDGFEEKLQEDGSKEQQQLAKEMQQQNRRMNLNLNEMSLDDLQGLMSEEDMVVAKIMRDQGNVLNIGV